MESKIRLCATKQSGIIHNGSTCISVDFHFGFTISSAFSTSLPSSNIDINFVESQRCVLRWHLHIHVDFFVRLGIVMPLPICFIVYTTLEGRAIRIPFIFPCSRCSGRCGRRQRCQIGIMDFTSIILAHDRLVAIDVVLFWRPLCRRECFNI